MRIAFTILFPVLVIALAACAVKARRSNKAIGRYVALLAVGLIPPVIGNLLIIASSSETISIIGCYTYFIGMDLAVLALIRFTFAYCDLNWPNRVLPFLVYGILIADAIQLLLNPVFGHAFTTEVITVEGADYYSLVPLTGQAFHRIVDYGVFAASIIIFIVKVVRAPRIDMERYGVILFAMIVTGIWQTFYIFSRTPMDRSMIGFGVFGLLVYFFAIWYKPVRLLDHMLANVASEIPEAMFFFDANGHCIWVNASAHKLIGIGDDLEKVPDLLRKMFGEWRQNASEWKGQYSSIDKDKEKTYVIERHLVTDDRGRLAGSFLQVRDNTMEQKTLQREIHHATHDSLTGVYNRSGYSLLMDHTKLETTCMLLIDIDYFKDVNDEYGHTTGDLILKKLTETVQEHFRSEDPVSRIGGDEFVVLLSDVHEKMDDLIKSKIDAINEKLGQPKDGLPPISVSVGVAYGKDAESREEMFEQADKALYAAKEGGRKSCVFYDRLSDQMAGPDSHSRQDSRQENVAGTDSHNRQEGGDRA